MLSHKLATMHIINICAKGPSCLATQDILLKNAQIYTKTLCSTSNLTANKNHMLYLLCIRC